MNASFALPTANAAAGANANAKSGESRPRILADSTGAANQKAAALLCRQAAAAQRALQQRLHRVRPPDGDIELADLLAGEPAQALRVGLADEQRADLAELRDGYAFRLAPGALATTADWVALESRCCPFFAFELELESHGGPLWLRICGAEDVKAFIREELGL